MARFPIKEAAVMTLAEEIIAGLETHTDRYPAPPVPVAAMTATMAACLDARNQAVAAQAAAELAFKAKKKAMAALIAEMKRNLRYAETTVEFDDASLKLLGWGGPKPPTRLQTPGQCPGLKITGQNERQLQLAWQAPTDGGKPAAYQILRRQRPGGTWVDAGMAVETTITLTDQPPGIQLEYRVHAVNKTGKSQPSNTILTITPPIPPLKKNKCTPSPPTQSQLRWRGV